MGKAARHTTSELSPYNYKFISPIFKGVFPSFITRICNHVMIDRGPTLEPPTIPEYEVDWFSTVSLTVFPSTVIPQLPQELQHDPILVNRASSGFLRSQVARSTAV